MFVVFEGIDGSGKTTVARLLVERLTATKSTSVLLTAEPTYQGIGGLLRETLHNQDPSSLRDVHFIEYMALAMAADRQQHYWKFIHPALQEGSIVLCDRFCWSSYAYQGAHGVDLGWLVSVNSQVPVPDLTVLIRLDPQVALTRVVSKGSKDLFEVSATLQKVSAAYQWLGSGMTGFASIDDANVLVVHGTLTPNELVGKILARLEEAGAVRT